ncbi:MAG: VPA1267 family protein [Rhodocyclaceae bacterium]|nr:VPA1267 family protein [Rhodocyclaceae bacterium]
MSTQGLSGQQIAANNLQKFQSWILERDATADWLDYVRQGKLNRSEIATECGFALSVVRQNPAVKAALEALESRLQASGILENNTATSSMTDATADIATIHAVDRRIMAAKSKAEQRVKSLEEQNAALKAELRDVREQLKNYRYLDEHLCATGRLLYA